MSISTLSTHVVVQRSSDTDQWFAKMGKTADGEHAVIFFSAKENNPRCSP